MGARQWHTAQFQQAKAQAKAQAMAETADKKVIRDTDQEARQLARRLISTARFAALAAMPRQDGDYPSISRVQVSTDIDGTPVVLASSLSPHTGAMIANPKTSLLVGEPGKGDPLAHPRITLFTNARRIERESEAHTRIRRRHLARNPKAALYADFGDFSFFRLEMAGASLNGGFGRAYNLTAEELALGGDAKGMAAMEPSAIEHMNSDHADAVALYAEKLAGAKHGKWRVIAMDAAGMDLALADALVRVSYPEPLESAADLRKALKQMADAARAAGEP